MSKHTTDKTQQIIINKNTTPVAGAPKLVLNNIDRLYLATAVKSVRNLTFIYTLVCRNTGNRQYEIFPVTEVATFDNAHDAAIYHQTVNQVMAYQQKMQGPQQIAEMLNQEIITFKQLMR